MNQFARFLSLSAVIVAAAEPILAQPNEVPAPAPTASAAPANAPVIGETGDDLAQLTASGLRVISDVEGLIVIDTRDRKPLAGSKLLFVRLRQGEFEILARGKVEATQGTTSLVKIDKDSILKYPMPGDLAISLGAPWEPNRPVEPNPAPDFLYAEDPPPAGDPGYIDLVWGNLAGSLDSSGNNDANRYKKAPTFSFGLTRATIFFNFAWRLGLEYESAVGTYPTSTYFREQGSSVESLRNFALILRTRTRFNDLIRLSGRLISFNHSFTTINTDENLISSTYSGLGLSGRIAFEWTPTFYTPSGNFGMTLQEVWAEAGYFPKVDAQDLVVLRGSSSEGSTGTEWRLGASIVTYLNWIPWFKRYIVSFVHGQRDYALNFSGPTRGEPGGYVIPENGRYQETRSYTQISIGVRFDDFIGKFLNPR